MRNFGIKSRTFELLSIATDHGQEFCSPNSALKRSWLYGHHRMGCIPFPSRTERSSGRDLCIKWMSFIYSLITTITVKYYSPKPNGLGVICKTKYTNMLHKKARVWVWFWSAAVYGTQNILLGPREKIQKKSVWAYPVDEGRKKSSFTAKKGLLFFLAFVTQVGQASNAKICLRTLFK